MKLVAACHHMPEGRSLELAEELGNPEHEGRFITVLELCPDCLPDFLPERGNGPLGLKERRRLVEELGAIWRGGTMGAQ